MESTQLHLKLREHKVQQWQGSCLGINKDDEWDGTETKSPVTLVLEMMCTLPCKAAWQQYHNVF